MPSEEEIIIIGGGGKPKAQVFVEDARNVWRYYSTWAFALIAGLPDLYNLAAPYLSGGEVPDMAVWTFRVAAILGILARYVNQNKPKAE